MDRSFLEEFAKSLETMEKEEVTCPNCLNKFFIEVAAQECPLCGAFCEQQWVATFGDALQEVRENAIKLCYDYYKAVCDYGKKLKDFDTIERVLAGATLYKQLGDQWKEKNHLFFFDFTQLAEKVDYATKQSKENKEKTENSEEVLELFNKGEEK